MKLDEDYRKDFEDSVIATELEDETIPAELMAEFEESARGHDIVTEVAPDIWRNSDIMKKR